MKVRLVQPDAAEQWAAARRLVEEYAASIRVDLHFQNFEAEVDNLAREYGPPAGAFLLAVAERAHAHAHGDEHEDEDEQEPGRECAPGTDCVGCVALREFSAGVCEMKRLYVAPSGRGHGIGRLLVEGIIAQARRLGYERMVLDTLPFMHEARALYRSLGFEPTSAYRFNPVPGAAFLELRLRDPSGD